LLSFYYYYYYYYYYYHHHHYYYYYYYCYSNIKYRVLLDRNLSVYFLIISFSWSLLCFN